MRIPDILIRPPAPKKRWENKDDPQVHKVYGMERCFIGWTVGTHNDRELLESVARHACRKWKVPLVPLKISKSKELIYGSSGDDHIWLNAADHKPGDNLGVLVHELAHWITDHIYGLELEDHGPEFVYVYGKLLDQYNLFPFDCYVLLCERFDVEILCSPQS